MRTSETAPPPSRRWSWILFAAVLVGLMTFVLSPKIQEKFGVADYGLWFLDSYAVLAASDTAAAGGNPDLPMRMDHMHRSHHYSDWWLGLRYLGVSRADNFLVGGSWVAALLITACLFLRPASARQTLWYLSLMLSPPILMAFTRANNDFVVFALLASAAIALGRPTVPRLIFALAAVALATGLKYYPVVAGVVFLLVRPKRRLTAMGLAATVVLGLVLADVAPSMIRRGYFYMPKTIGTFGAGMIFQYSKLNAREILLSSTVLIGVFALGLVKTGWLQIPTQEKRDRWQDEQAGFVFGAVVLVACFLAGLSFNYRCMFGLLLAPWLWRQAPVIPAARLALWLTAAMLWCDGLYYITVNSLAGSISAEWDRPITHSWILVTQVLVWILMSMLAGWLLEFIFSAWETWRTDTKIRVQTA